MAPRAYASTLVCTCELLVVRHPLWIYANPLYTHFLYTRQNPEFMSSGTIYVCFQSQVAWRNETRQIVRFIHDR